MIILGVNDGHNSSACLIIDGKLKCAIAEERLSREKNHFGYPKKSIDFILKYCYSAIYLSANQSCYELFKIFQF